MPKVLLVAFREYRAAVQTKAFLITLLLVPVLYAFSFGVQLWILKTEASETKRHVVVDRTGALRPTLELAEEHHNSVEIYDATTKVREAPKYQLEFVEPSADTPEAMLVQRLELSERQSKGEIEGFVEIGPDVFEVAAESAVDDRHAIRFQSEKIAAHDFARWATKAIERAIQEQRFQAQNVSRDTVRRIQTPTPARIKGLTKKNPRTGAIEEPSDETRLASFFLPGALVLLMFMLVVLGAVPAMQGIVEEKQQRIVEVLLGCLSPFELMLGKLLGVIAVSMTTGAVYLAGGGVLAARFGVASLLSPALIGWFLLFTILAVLVFGSLFMAIGAAAGDLKETQSLQAPIMVTATLPVMLLGAILREPNGTVALVGSFVPLSAPMLMTARLASPANIPVWQPILAVVEVLSMSLLCVWAASRIFRVGLLLQGKGVRLGDLARWVLRG
jgi:ABC-2 type transport system permease protein